MKKLFAILGLLLVLLVTACTPGGPNPGNDNQDGNQNEGPGVGEYEET